jgi:putative FmdB family regulatory protein
MPIYEFKCRNCENVFEVMGKYEEHDKPQTCPTCGGSEVKPRISVSSAPPPSSSF